MNVSRRSFLGTGSKLGLAALLTGRLSSLAFGQNGSSLGTGIGTTVPKETLGDPLYRITRAMFTDNLKTKFTFGDGGVKLTGMKLVAVESLNPPGSRVSAMSTRDCFSLTFRGPADLPLRQGTYTVDHANLGRFSLFIVPGDSDYTARLYVAIINRLNP